MVWKSASPGGFMGFIFPWKGEKCPQLLHRTSLSSCNILYWQTIIFRFLRALCASVCVCSDLCRVICLRCDGPLTVVMFSTDHLWNTDVTVDQWSAARSMNCCVTVMWLWSLTLQRVSGQAQLTDDVSRDVSLHQVSFFSMIFSRLQQMIELFRVKLL